MSELKIETWVLPSAELGPDNPLAPIQRIDRKYLINESSGIPSEIIRNSAYGHVTTILPYTFQDSFSRQLNPKEFRVAILENEILRAAFLLELGGRMWSLIHKPSGQELLEVNPAIQFANLAIRRAWFCGGVEWNIGTTGHSPFTCSPLFAGRIELPDGTPVLRLYEWERFRDAPFQIDIFLPDRSPLLFVKSRIINPHNHTIPIYCWSNIAVPNHEGTRVVVPAESAYCLGCHPDGLTRIRVPEKEGIDITYPANVDHAADYFFYIPVGQYPWITALDVKGKGIVQVSTSRMVGKKLWVWGQHPAGRNWQKFLSTSDEGYIEIQAGLTFTQLEHLPMPACTNWSWLEAYGLLEVNPGIVHNQDWRLVQEAVDKAVKRLIPKEKLLAQFEFGKAFEDTNPEQIIQAGSGWGALEHHRRLIEHETPVEFSGVNFDDNFLTDQQQPWIQLLESNTFPEPSPEKVPIGFVSGKKWEKWLIHSIQSNQKDNWFAWYHLGVIQYQAGDISKACSSWNHSLNCLENPWSLRNLALVEWDAGRYIKAADMLQIAQHQLPDLVPLTIECVRCLIAAGQEKTGLELVRTLPVSIRSLGRIRFLEAHAAIKEGDLTLADQFFKDGGLIEDLREGEQSHTDLWFELQHARLSTLNVMNYEQLLTTQIEKDFPPPENIDYRMNP